VGQVVVLRAEPDVKHALRGLELSTTRPGGAAETRQIPIDELAGVLADPFGVSLDNEEVAGLRLAVR
jgi:hypothetical protein